VIACFIEKLERHAMQNRRLAPRPEQLIISIESCVQSIKQYRTRLDTARSEGDDLDARRISIFLSECQDTLDRLTVQLDAALFLERPRAHHLVMPRKSQLR
jgi:hypothetical protein